MNGQQEPVGCIWCSRALLFSSGKKSERNLKEILQEFQRNKAGTLKKSCLDQEIEVEVGLQEDNGCIWTSCSNHTLTSCIRVFKHLD